jgi:DNA-binding transcriptional ArsR family regulator
MAAASNDPSQSLLFVLHHPLRRRLLRLYIESEEPLSPKELSDFTRQPLSNVGYHVRALSEHGAVELVETQPRRGSVEHFYKATSLVPATPWALASLGLSPNDK